MKYTKEEIERIEELKHNENLLYRLIDKLQCDFANNKRFMEYLIKIGFSEIDINKICFELEVEENE